MTLASPLFVPTAMADALPVFKSRWWYSDKRLDARPVIWSLDNRPEEWVLLGPGKDHERLCHMPSDHKLWTRGLIKGDLQARCSCSGRGWQIFQRASLRRAMNRWIRKHGARPALAEQFAAHFVH